jgi:hypothetical protein
MNMDVQYLHRNIIIYRDILHIRHNVIPYVILSGMSRNQSNPEQRRTPSRTNLIGIPDINADPIMVLLPVRIILVSVPLLLAPVAVHGINANRQYYS